MKKVMLRFGALLGARRGEARGTISGLPVSADVEVLKDASGVPHIFAENEDDLFTAQGFIHAQDRLWQMEVLRRLPAGRVAEVAGPSMADVDHFSLLAGFERIRRQALAAATDGERHVLEAYVRGVNAYLAWAGKRLPIEFRNLGFTPAEWCVEDLCGVLPFTSWSLQTNYEQELFALHARDRLDAELFNELYPVAPDIELPRESFFEQFRHMRIAPLHPAAFAFIPDLRPYAGAAASEPQMPIGAQAGTAVSNCWVTAQGSAGAPLLANDPHLGMMVPQVWHLCHLQCPTLNACGASMLGCPGIILGRNEEVAWGVTNVMADVVDLCVVRVDPEDPTRYYIGEETHEMSREATLIPVAGGEPREVVLYHTVHGTVLSRLEKGSEAVVVLKWYGTMPDAYEERTIGCFLNLLRARDVGEVLEIGGQMKSACQNLTAADTAGNIGWKVTGLVPNRRGYSGRVPADGSDPSVGWEGFVPYEQTPSALNPESGWIATANNKTVEDGAVHPITYTWLATYRRDRIVSLLEEEHPHSVESFERMQMDVHSLQAERLLPGLFAFDFTDEEARKAVEILRDWDFRCAPGSAGAAVFLVFLTELKSVLTQPLLAECLPLFFSFSGFFYGPADVLLTGGKPVRLLESAGFQGEGAARDACEEALRRSMQLLRETLGADTGEWRWGDLHTYHYVHPGAGGRLAAWLLNRGPYPAYGTCTTVNVSAFDPARYGDTRTKYCSVTVPSLRLVTSLADPDSTTIIAPMGQSGRPGNRHYDDMIGRWIRGDRLPLPLTRAAAERIEAERLVLGS